MGGQFIHYLPDYDLLFVTTADTQGLAGGNQLIYDALYDEILPFIQADPLPEDQKRIQSFFLCSLHLRLHLWAIVQ